ncbi:MAG: hypothetical protein JJE04_06675 [Acidobacteriia bacterium]|nr:hypothetical protein [Terriglobia bacterium]
MQDLSPIQILVARVRRRSLANLIVEQATVGAIAALCGAIVLLLVGSQILEWYWLVVLFAVGTGVGAWRTLRRLPDPYRSAQQVDERLGLHDAISTAWYFHQSGSTSALAQPQRAEALRLAASADARSVMAWKFPRQTYAAAALLVGALSLFLLRFGIRGSLDLRQPLVEAVADFFRPDKAIQARGKKPPNLPGDDPIGIALDPGQQQQELEAAPDSVLMESQTPDVNNADGRASERAQKANVKAQGDEGDPLMDSSEEGERGKGESGRQDGADGGGKQSGGEPPDQANSPQGSPQGNGQESNSLMDKMRDAMANLMSKLKIPPQGGKNSQSAEAKGGQQSGKKEAAGQKGKPGEGSPQGKGAPSDDSNADQQGQGDQQAQAGQGKGSDKGSDQNGPNEAKSGMGKQDGSKDLKDAEQAAAMGKLSEIYGKRAANVTGEVMVEVNSGKQQQLRTAYSKSAATHKEAGGEIHRDEIPLDMQHYVQQYFENVRKGEVTPKESAPQEPAPGKPSEQK